MGLKVGGQVINPAFPNFPGGLRPPGEEMARASEGGFLDIDFGDFARILAGVGQPRVPVGPSIDRRDLGFPKGGSLPTLVSTPVAKAPRGIFKEDIGGGLPQIAEVLPILARTVPSKVISAAVVPEIQPGAIKMPDLGGILGAVGDFIPGPDFFDLGANLLGYGGPQQFAGATGSSTPVQSPTISQAPTVQQGMPTMAVGGGCEADPRSQYVLKFICGNWKWVKKRKRRSKRLATASDIKDLSALQGVLGNGKNLTTWIATHR